MSINDLVENVKSRVAPFYTLILCLVIAGIFFCLGRLSAIEDRHTPIRIIQPENGQAASAVSAVFPKGTPLGNDSAQAGESGQVVASKNGTKYYFPWCGGVKNIKPENIVTFASVEAAKAKGYSPAANCKGLK